MTLNKLNKGRALKILPFFFVFVLFLVFGSGASTYFRFFELILRMALFFALLIIPGFFLLKLIHNKFFNNDLSFLLSIPISIVLYLLIFLILHNLKSSPIIYLIVNLLIFLLIIFLSQLKGQLREILKLSDIIKYGFIAVFLASLIALCFVHVHVKNPRKEITKAEIVARRGLEKLPADNRLQYDTAKSFIDYEEPWIWKSEWGWTMGDRPPLMGTLFSIFALSSQKSLSTFWDYQILGTILNALFLLPLLLIAQKLFKNRNVSYFLIIIVFLNAFIFTNIYYTWPKLFGVYFCLISIALLLEESKSLTFALMSGGLWGLASLAHLGTILSLPFLFLIYSLYIIRTKRGKGFIYIISFLFLLVLFHIPWIAYKQKHPEINTQRLMHHYMPEEYYPESFAQKDTFTALSRFFSDYSLKEHLSHRISNLKTVIKSQAVALTFEALFQGRWGEYFKRIYKKVFLYPIPAIGEIPILMCLLVIPVMLISSISRRKQNKQFDLNVKWIGFFFGVSLFGYIFNILLKWSPSYNHELPYLELMMAIIIFYGISFSFHPMARNFLLCFSFLNFLNFLWLSSLELKFHLFDFFNIMAVIGAIAMVVMATKFESGRSINSDS